MENQIYNGSEKIQSRADINELLDRIANDLVSPIQDFFKGISLSAKDKFLVAQLVLAMLMGVVTSSQSSEVEKASSQDIEFSIDNFRYATPSELGKATHCVIANPDITVNVRSGPGINYPAISSISGTKALPLDSELITEGWYKIMTADGTSAWASADYVQKMTCDEYAAVIESNQPFVQLPRVTIGDLSIFNIEATPFTPEIIKELMDLISVRAQSYEGAWDSHRPLAVAFGTEEQMFELLPNFKQQLRVMGSKDYRFASGTVPAATSEVTVTPEGLLVARQYRYGGETHTLIFIQVPENSEIPSFRLFQLLVHEGIHAKAGDIADHDWLEESKEYDYTENNPAEREGNLAVIAADGADRCEVQEVISEEACIQYANILFGNTQDVIVYPPGTLDVKKGR
jgi:uncharacterized protein YgiM (DUF1202 family)